MANPAGQLWNSMWIIEVLPAVLAPAHRLEVLSQYLAGPGRRGPYPQGGALERGALEACWKPTRQNFAAHGMKSIMTSIVEEPWHSQAGVAYPSMVKWSYPGEFKSGLSRTSSSGISAIFDRYVSLMIDAGNQGQDRHVRPGQGARRHAGCQYRLQGQLHSARCARWRWKSASRLWEEIWIARSCPCWSSTSKRKAGSISPCSGSMRSRSG